MTFVRWNCVAMVLSRDAMHDNTSSSTWRGTAVVTRLRACFSSRIENLIGQNVGSDWLGGSGLTALAISPSRSARS